MALFINNNIMRQKHSLGLELNTKLLTLPLEQLESDALRTIIIDSYTSLIAWGVPIMTEEHDFLTENATEPTRRAYATLLEWICNGNSTLLPPDIHDDISEDLPEEVVDLFTRIVTEYEDIRTSSTDKQLNITDEEHSFLAYHSRKSFRDSYLSFLDWVRNNNTSFLPEFIK